MYFAIGAISGDTSNIAYSNINVTVNGGTCTIDKIENSDGSPCVKLPQYLSVDGTTVKRYWNGVPENLVIPDGVTAISNWAFQDCPSKTIVIPDGVKSIGIGAFSNCRNLANVEIPGSVTEIGGSAFSYCSALTSVVIPDGVTTIGEYAFGECNSLTSVSIPATVTEIGFRAFPSYYSSDYYSLGLVIYYGGTAAEWQSVNKHDEDDKYDYFSKNISVLCTDTPKNLPSYLRVQGTKITRSDRDNIPANLEIPKGITEIGDSAFYYCGQLINVELPDSVTKIGRGAFQSCSALTGIVIPNNMTEIGEYAFEDCNLLRNITIPSSVKLIGYYAFPRKWESDSASRLVIHYGGTSVEWWKLIENATYDDGYGGKPSGEYVISECITVLCSDTPTVDGSLIVQGTTITMCDRNSVPASLAIPEGITEIGYNAFNNCSSLTSVTIPASVTSIGDYAFDWCTSLASVTIGDGVKIIGRYAFYMCTNLMSVTYKGTKAQWNAITKETDWNSSTGNYTITCTDGNINKN
ncbi:MAG: leucine-rich repeat domain-containing protein [Treponemataceae bacterium]|nr:leucine-rich repeat domain-containing protein [Treponemataceae bacterium]